MAKAKLTEKEKAEIKESAKKVALKEVGFNEKDAKIIETVLKEAKMPVELNDKDFTLGEGELDIRKLSKENKEQMMFRMLLLNVVYGRQITQSLVDVLRLIMLVLKKMGCEDIIKETDELLAKLSIQTEDSQKSVKN